MSELLWIDGRRVALSTHAIERYCSRVDRVATEVDVAAAVSQAGFQTTTPGWVAWAWKAGADGRADAWLVGRGWAMALKRAVDARNSCDFVAVTCVQRVRLSAADRRLRRDQAAEDAWAS